MMFTIAPMAALVLSHLMGRKSLRYKRKNVNLMKSNAIEVAKMIR